MKEEYEKGKMKRKREVEKQEGEARKRVSPGGDELSQGVQQHPVLCQLPVQLVRGRAALLRCLALLFQLRQASVHQGQHVHHAVHVHGRKVLNVEHR